MSDMDVGVRTEGARRLVRRSIRNAMRRGHDPVLVTKAGYMELYACRNSGCTMTFDCWDSPEICNGPMPRARCRSSQATQRDRNIFSWLRVLSAWLRVGYILVKRLFVKAYRFAILEKFITNSRSE